MTFLDECLDPNYSYMNSQLSSNPSMDTLASRVKAARMRRNWTQAELALQAGMRQAEISKLENGMIARTTRLASLAHALQCDPYWLATGTGQPWGQKADESLEFDGRGGNVVGIPVRGSSYFLPLPEGFSIDPNDASVKGVVMGSGVHDGYAVRVRGDANAPALKDGQFVVIEKAPVRTGDLGLFHLEDGTAMLFELIRETDDVYYVDSAAWGSRETLDKIHVAYTEAIVAIVSPSRWVPLET